MEHIKDLLNFKENKKYKITIIILLIIVIFMQTGLSITKKKIRILTENTKKLNEQIRENETSNIYNESDSIDDLITDKDPKKDTVDYTAKKSELINRFKEIGKLENKFYNPDIKDGKKYLVFETINLEVTDNQIKSTFKNIISNEFGIEITENKLAENKFFKIYLIEKN
jgi:hypothetical protein